MFIRNSSVISVFANNGYEKRRKWFEWGKELKVHVHLLPNKDSCNRKQTVFDSKGFNLYYI